MQTAASDRRYPNAAARAATRRDARDLLWKHRYRLAAGLALMLVSRAAAFVPPASFKWLIDDVVGKGRTELLTPIVLAVMAATVVQVMTSFALVQILALAAQRAITDMRKRVQAHIVRLPVRFFDSTQTGALVSRIMTDTEGVRNLVGSGLVQMAVSVVTAALGLGVLIWINWRMTVIIVIVLAVFGGTIAYGFRTLRTLFRERAQLNAEVTARLTESVNGIRVVKSYTAERREQVVFAKGSHRLLRILAASITRISATTAGGTVIVGVMGALMAWLGSSAVLAGEMTLGELMVYVFCVGMVAAPFISLATTGTQITDALTGLERIRELLSVPNESDNQSRTEIPGPLRGDVEFDNVWFEYEPGQPVLRGVSFTAASGTTTALVGSSGAGKSTLAGLIMAFNRPTTGRILVDGRDLAGMRLLEYRQQLAAVLQESVLFDGTIADNVAYAAPAAALDAIKQACRVAHCDEFIEQFPDGYDTVVGERGVNLAGGERQRLSIARAILANPRILILDEATSSLHSESEAMVRDGLRRLRAGRTTFVIAHRLSTIQSADQILVLEAGEIVERGTHAQLLAADGRYRRLYDQQYTEDAEALCVPTR